MQSIRKSILTNVNLRTSTVLLKDGSLLKIRVCIGNRDVGAHQQVPALILDQIIAVAKKYDKIYASKVTETADFQKDLNLDSLDRVELIMALEEKFSVEIPDDKADNLTCCADVAKYIASETDQKNVGKP